MVLKMCKIQFRNEDCLTTINKIKEQGKKIQSSMEAKLQAFRNIMELNSDEITDEELVEFVNLHIRTAQSNSDTFIVEGGDIDGWFVQGVAK